MSYEKISIKEREIIIISPSNPQLIFSCFLRPGNMPLATHSWVGPLLCLSVEISKDPLMFTLQHVNKCLRKGERNMA